jgi:hypothetical protein
MPLRPKGASLDMSGTCPMRCVSSARRWELSTRPQARRPVPPIRRSCSCSGRWLPGAALLLPCARVRRDSRRWRSWYFRTSCPSCAVRHLRSRYGRATGAFPHARLGGGRSRSGWPTPRRARRLPPTRSLLSGLRRSAKYVWQEKRSLNLRVATVWRNRAVPMKHGCWWRARHRREIRDWKPRACST